MSVVIAVPVLVWLMHGRRLSLSAVLGGAMGACSTGVVFIVVVAAASLVDLVITPLTGWEYTGPLAMLAVISIGALVLIVWLIIDAIRDLAATNRSHPLIDVLRLVSVVTLGDLHCWRDHVDSRPPGDETVEALVFALVAGLSAAPWQLWAPSSSPPSGRPDAPPKATGRRPVKKLHRASPPRTDPTESEAGSFAGQNERHTGMIRKMRTPWVIAPLLITIALTGSGCSTQTSAAEASASASPSATAPVREVDYGVDEINVAVGQSVDFQAPGPGIWSAASSDEAVFRTIQPARKRSLRTPPVGWRRLPGRPLSP